MFKKMVLLIRSVIVCCCFLHNKHMIEKLLTDVKYQKFIEKNDVTLNI